MAPPDFYALLGVDRAATNEQVRNAYRDCAMQHHPDRGGDPAVWSALQRAYDTLSDPQKRAVYDRTKQDGSVGAEKAFGQAFAEKGEGAAQQRGLSIEAEMAEAKGKGSTLAAAGFDMSHAQGFEAWMRNQKGMGKQSFYTAEDLLRSRQYGNIEATESTAQPLPALSATAVRFDAHGPPEEVLYVDRACSLPDKLAHGEVLVHMLAACVTDEDLLRVQTPLTVLNDFPPFNRTNNKWEAVPLPATAGVEGVGVVIATAKNVPTLKDHPLEVKDWVLLRPEARRRPAGCWSTMAVVDSSMLVKVPAQLMPVRHLACSRSLCTAYRLLEDYGSLRPGDTIIQNAADLPVGQAVIQLCKMLKIRSINLVPDDEGFERTKELLVQLGATHVLRDNSKLAEFLEALGSEMPRLALDSLGGDAGRRLAIALRPGGALVVHSMQSGQVPQLSPSLIMYQQVSLYGFNLSQWVSEHGAEAYLQMLRTLAELVQAERLNVFTRTLPVERLDADALAAALSSHRAVQDAKSFRERTVFLLGSEAAANDVYFEVSAAIRRLESSADNGFDPASPPYRTPGGSSVHQGKSPAAGAVRPSERWADAGAMLKELELEQYVSNFEEEEMTSMALLEDIVNRSDGEKELMEALKEMGIKKMGHRQTIVGAVLGKL
mmetsp:Transcript_5381/g.18058  ORF Transcript_5381/g.18058 Transcript_5381/m.18058 type:complete len:660 (+) Transcript_5381:81-2060(+)